MLVVMLAIVCLCVGVSVCNKIFQGDKADSHKLIKQASSKNADKSEEQ